MPATSVLPQQNYAALSLDQLMSWMREIRANPRLLPSRKVVAMVLATYHNSSTGWTFPGLSRLAKDTGLHRETIIASYRDLEAEGHLEHVERYSGRARLSHQYNLKLRAANDDVVELSDHTPSIEPTTRQSVQPTVTTKLNDITERAVDALTRRAQRLANGKGWRMDNARETVQAALQRAGKEAVEQTLVKLEEGNQRPAYELAGIFGSLRRADRIVAPDLSEGPRDAAYRQADGIYQNLFAGGVVDFSARMRVHKAVAEAGISGTRWWNRQEAVPAIAVAIRAGTIEAG